MLKKTVKYTDFDGDEVQEDFYFNITRSEIVEMEVSEVGGFSEALKALQKEEDPQKIIAYFKKIILWTYGEKSADGRHFIKTPELAEAFTHHAAFSDIFMELAENADAAAEFIRGVMPAGFNVEEFDKEIEKARAAQGGVENVELPAVQEPSPNETEFTEPEDEPAKTWESYTRAELVEMPKSEFDQLAGSDPNKMPRELLVIAMQRKN